MFDQLFGGRHHKTTKVVCLADLKEGEHATILSVEGSDGDRGRLCALGLTPGTDIEVTHNGSGQCTMVVRGCTVVLGSELFAHIRCRSNGAEGRRKAFAAGHEQETRRSAAVSAAGACVEVI